MLERLGKYILKYLPLNEAVFTQGQFNKKVYHLHNEKKLNPFNHWQLSIQTFLFFCSGGGAASELESPPDSPCIFATFCLNSKNISRI